jgi:hypothetical protein
MVRRKKMERLAAAKKQPSSRNRGTAARQEKKMANAREREPRG